MDSGVELFGDVVEHAVDVEQLFLEVDDGVLEGTEFVGAFVKSGHDFGIGSGWDG